MFFGVDATALMDGSECFFGSNKFWEIACQKVILGECGRDVLTEVTLAAGGGGTRPSAPPSATTTTTTIIETCT